MASATFYLPNGAADVLYGSVDTQAFLATGINIALGKGNANNKLHGSFCFGSVAIPQGATIVTALLSFKSFDNFNSTTVNLVVYGNAVDNAAPPTTWAQADGLAATTANVPWNNLPAWTTGTRYTAPDVKVIIQEIVNRSGWVSGNNLQLMVRAAESTDNNANRIVTAYEIFPTDTQLYIEWGSDPAIGEDFSMHAAFAVESLSDQIDEALTLNAAFSSNDFPSETLAEDLSLNASFELFAADGDLGEDLTLNADFSADVVQSSHYSLAKTLPLMTMEASAEARSIAGHFQLPMLTMTGSMNAGEVLSLNKTLPMMGLSASILPGTVLSAAMTSPGLTLSGSGFEDEVLSLSQTLPLLRLNASILSIASTYPVIVMNPRNFAVTEYTGWTFNSFASFMGQYLGAKSTGIHKLTGSNDAGTAISGSFKLGKLDMEHSKARDVWVLGKATGHMNVSISADEGADALFEEDYLVVTLGQDRVTVPRGLLPIYLQVGASNIAGCGFDIDAIQIYGEQIKRKKR